MKSSRISLSPMSPRTLQILNAIADGLSYDGILAQFPHYTVFDIADAASSAIDFIDSVESSSLESHVRRVMVAISKGYGYIAIQQVCLISLLDISNSAYAVLELQRTETRPRKRRKKRRAR